MKQLSRLVRPRHKKGTYYNVLAEAREPGLPYIEVHHLAPYAEQYPRPEQVPPYMIVFGNQQFWPEQIPSIIALLTDAYDLVQLMKTLDEGNKE